MNPEILVCSTTYEPTAAELTGLMAQFDTLGERGVIFDNTVRPDRASSVRDHCDAAGILYLTCGANIGTAGALNRLLQHAVDSGAKWMLYLDQDSRVVTPSVAESFRQIAEVGDNVALVGSRLVHADGALVQATTPDIRYNARFVISSGTYMRVSALVEVDGFDEALGLDLADTELCLRIRNRGLMIVSDGALAIRHEIGRGSRTVPLLHIRITRHPLWRRRDMWRNSILLVRRYGHTVPLECFRHLVGRVAETVIGAVVFRDATFLTSAVVGACEGITASPHRVGISERSNPDVDRWRSPEVRGLVNDSS